MSITAVEAALVDRLTAVVKTERELVQMVYAHQDYADVAEVNMVTPSLAVIYNGYTPGGQPGDKPVPVQSIALGFIVVVNVASALQTDRGDGVRLEASPIIDAVLEALLGWRPIPKFQPLKLEPAPGAAVSDAGFGYYPLAFSTTATYRGIL